MPKTRSTAQKTLELFCENGWYGDLTEMKRGKASKDWADWADMIVFRGPCVMGIQATTVQNYHAHARTMLGNPICRKWVEAGHKALLFCWTKKGGFRELLISPADFELYEMSGALPKLPKANIEAV